MQKNGDPYNCVMTVIRVEKEYYSLYFGVSEGFNRSALLGLIQEEEVFKFAKAISGEIIGYTIEKRVELSDDGVNRVVEVLEKSSFSNELIPVPGELNQPTGYVGNFGIGANLTKNCQELTRSGTRRLIAVTRKTPDRTIWL
jgi:hypothetical protein